VYVPGTRGTNSATIACWVGEELGGVNKGLELVGCNNYPSCGNCGGLYSSRWWRD